MSEENYYDELDNKREKIKEIISEVRSGKKQIHHDSIEKILTTVFDYRVKGNEIKSKVELKGKYFKYIPYSREHFADLIIRIQKKHKCKNFIDVGCGIGDKVILAYLFGGFDRVTGIEYNETTYHVAKYFILDGMFTFENFTSYYKPIKGNKLPKNSWDVDDTKIAPKTKKEIIQGDAFNYDFSGHDFIYLYVPIGDYEIMQKLHDKIVLEMPIGGIIIDVGAMTSVKKAVEKIKNVKINTGKKEQGIWYPNYTQRTGEKSYKYYRLDGYGE